MLTHRHRARPRGIFNFQRGLKRLAIALPIAFVISIFTNRAASGSVAVQEAVRTATGRPQVVEALGEPVRRLEGTRSLSLFMCVGASRDYEVRLAGPKGEGRLRVTLVRWARGKDRVEKLLFQPEGGQGWRDVLEDPRPPWLQKKQSAAASPAAPANR